MLRLNEYFEVLQNVTNDMNFDLEQSLRFR
jgi:hypothetical protein